MAQIKATFDGGIVADPEFKEAVGQTIQEIVVYVNHSRKNRDTQQYEPTGDVSKIRVSLWGDLSKTPLQKGDIVEIVGTLVEKEFDKRDGTKGRQLQTGYVESITVKWRKSGAPAPRVDAGFIPAPTSNPLQAAAAAGAGF